MTKFSVFLRLATTLLTLMQITNVQAGVQLSNTRVVFDEGRRNASVYAKNQGDPVVVQTWIEGTGEKMETPFFITPPLSRFDSDTERTLTITRVGQEDLPSDRESYYWVNVLEIPQKLEGTANTLTFATRTRIKLFYRPKEIQGQPRGPQQLTWSLARQGNACTLQVVNASPFTVNFSRLDLVGQGKEFGRGVIALPLASTSVELKGCPAGSTLTPHVVNDYGAIEAWPVVTLQVGADSPSPKGAQ